MKNDLGSLLSLIIDKTRSGGITWIFRPNAHGGIAYGLSGSIKFARVNKTFMLSYYRVGEPVSCYTIDEETAGWFLSCRLYNLIRLGSSKG